MSRGLCGYGRYDDDHIGCPRAKSDMTPCVARDGKTAIGELDKCVGCGHHAADLLLEAVEVVSRIATTTGPGT